MYALSRMTLKSVMLAATEDVVREIFKLNLFRPGPIEIFEPPVMEHLIPTVHLYRVMAARAQEMAVPLFRTVIQKASSVDEHVQPAPPDVQVEHVDLREAVQYSTAAKDPEVGRIVSAQDVIAGVF